MKIAVTFLSLCGTWLGGQAVYTNTGQLYASLAGRDLVDDVTRHQFDVRSKLDCALAGVQTDYCGEIALCRREPRTYSKATIAWKETFSFEENCSVQFPLST